MNNKLNTILNSKTREEFEKLKREHAEALDYKPISDLQDIKIL